MQFVTLILDSHSKYVVLTTEFSPIAYKTTVHYTDSVSSNDLFYKSFLKPATIMPDLKRN
jgi:hypothetical protein